MKNLLATIDDHSYLRSMCVWHVQHNIAYGTPYTRSVWMTEMNGDSRVCVCVPFTWVCEVSTQVKKVKVNLNEKCCDFKKNHGPVQACYVRQSCVAVIV